MDEVVDRTADDDGIERRDIGNASPDTTSTSCPRSLRSRPSISARPLVPPIFDPYATRTRMRTKLVVVFAVGRKSRVKRNRVTNPTAKRTRFVLDFDTKNHTVPGWVLDRTRGVKVGQVQRERVTSRVRGIGSIERQVVAVRGVSPSAARSGAR